MSRKHYECCSYQPSYSGGAGYGAKGGNIGLVGIAILILVILQFKKGGSCKDHKKKCDYDDEYEVDYDDDYDKDHDDDYDEEYDECEEDHKERDRGSKPLVDNGILFIIALFYLSCCGKKCC
jgi:hypothetical protein